MYRTRCRHITHRVGTLATTSSQVACMRNIFWWEFNHICTYIQCHAYNVRTCIPSSEVMQLATGQSLTRWVGLLLLPTTTVNSYSVHGCRPLITYVSLVALDRVVPISLRPQAVFWKMVTISITCPLVKDVYVEKCEVFTCISTAEFCVCTVIWGGGFGSNCLLTSHIILKVEQLTASHTPHIRPVEIEKFIITTQLILTFLTHALTIMLIYHIGVVVFIHRGGIRRGEIGTQIKWQGISHSWIIASDSEKKQFPSNFYNVSF